LVRILLGVWLFLLLDADEGVSEELLFLHAASTAHQCSLRLLLYHLQTPETTRRRCHPFFILPLFSGLWVDGWTLGRLCACRLHDHQFLQILHLLPHGRDDLMLSLYLTPQLVNFGYVLLLPRGHLSLTKIHQIFHILPHLPAVNFERGCHLCLKVVFQAI